MDTPTNDSLHDFFDVPLIPKRGLAGDEILASPDFDIPISILVGDRDWIVAMNRG